MRDPSGLAAEGLVAGGAPGGAWPSKEGGGEGEGGGPEEMARTKA